MTYYYARNLQWGELEADNTVTVSFEIYTDEDVKIDGMQEVHGAVADIQQLIEAKVRTKSEAVALLEAIMANEEFAIEMTQVG